MKHNRIHALKISTLYRIVETGMANAEEKRIILFIFADATASLKNLDVQKLLKETILKITCGTI